VLVVHLRADPAALETEVFSTRSADRPNPIGIHRTEVLTVDGTSIVDLKLCSIPEPRA